MASSVYSSSSSDELRCGELIVDCTFPELLASDLERSRDIFLSKAMTAGSPCAGLAAPEAKGMPRMMGGPEERSMLSKQHWVEVAEERHGYESDGHRQVKDPPMPCSVHELADEPSSTRSGQQPSVTTEATSLSPCASSLFSQSAPPPASPAPSPCSSNQDGSMHTTWFEDEPESPQEDSENSVFTARTSVSDRPKGVPEVDDMGVSFNNAHYDSGESTADQNSTTMTAVASMPWRDQSTLALPLAPVSQVSREKPRIVDIPPPPGAGENKPHLSSPGSLSSLELALMKAGIREPFAPAPSVGRARLQTRVSSEGRRPEELGTGVSLLETANGRTLIDVTTIPLTEGHKDRAAHACFVEDDSESSDNEKQSRLKVLEDAHAAARKPSVMGLQRNVDARPNTPAPSRLLRSRHQPNAPPPGLPLPPEVVESLRVSILCFPETMLLTSSLSIEIIRAYSKKLRRGTPLDRPFPTADSEIDSLISSDSHKLERRPSRRWGWLGHARRGSNMNIKQQAHQEPLTARLTKSMSAAKTLRFRQSSEDGFRDSRPPPLWAPISNIFPLAPARLCDALYAHIIAYNYISLLCTSTPGPNSEPLGGETPQVSNPAHHRQPKHQLHNNQLSSSNLALARGMFPRKDHQEDWEIEDQITNKPLPKRPDTPLRVPAKAAMVLGMDMDGSFPPNNRSSLENQYQKHQQQQQPDHKSPNKLQRLLGAKNKSTHPHPPHRRNSSSISVTPPTLLMTTNNTNTIITNPPAALHSFSLAPTPLSPPSRPATPLPTSIFSTTTTLSKHAQQGRTTLSGSNYRASADDSNNSVTTATTSNSSGNNNSSNSNSTIAETNTTTTTTPSTPSPSLSSLPQLPREYHHLLTGLRRCIALLLDAAVTSMTATTATPAVTRYKNEEDTEDGGSMMGLFLLSSLRGSQEDDDEQQGSGLFALGLGGSRQVDGDGGGGGGSGEQQEQEVIELPTLVRALCEVVRAAEERGVDGV